MEIKNRLIFLLLVLFSTCNMSLEAYAARLYPEKRYQEAWCSKYGGVTEVITSDKVRVDCILPSYAIEFDFTNKWSEAIGQSLYYGYITQKKAGIVLILEDSAKDMVYLNRLNKIAKLYGITVWVMTPMDLKKIESSVCK